MSIEQKLFRYGRKVEIYKYYLDGSFDKRDKNRLKPLTRLRNSMEEIELNKKSDIKLRVRDWYNDIDRGYSK